MSRTMPTGKPRLHEFKGKMVKVVTRGGQGDVYFGTVTGTSYRGYPKLSPAVKVPRSERSRRLLKKRNKHPWTELKSATPQVGKKAVTVVGEEKTMQDLAEAQIEEFEKLDAERKKSKRKRQVRNSKLKQLAAYLRDRGLNAQIWPQHSEKIQYVKITGLIESDVYKVDLELEVSGDGVLRSIVKEAVSGYPDFMEAQRRQQEEEQRKKNERAKERQRARREAEKERLRKEKEEAEKQLKKLEENG